MTTKGSFSQVLYTSLFILRVMSKYTWTEEFIQFGFKEAFFCLFQRKTLSHVLPCSKTAENEQYLWHLSLLEFNVPFTLGFVTKPQFSNAGMLLRHHSTPRHPPSILGKRPLALSHQSNRMLLPAFCRLRCLVLDLGELSDKLHMAFP